MQKAPIVGVCWNYRALLRIVSLTPVRKSLLGAPHHDAEICVLVVTNTFKDGDSKSDFALKGRWQDMFDDSLGFCCRSREDS